MIKKIVTLLLLLSTASFANTPIRHRATASVPDGIPTQSAAQSRMAAVLQPALSSIRVPESVVALVDATVSRFDKMSPEDKGIVTDLISTAKRHIGARYHLGSSGPKSFDCSGFTSYVFRRMGITLNRSSREQHKQGEAVAQTQDLQPGDLVFFGRRGKRVNHVGIVTDVATDGTFHFIHASTSRGVRIDTTSDDYWSARYVGGRRIIGTEV